MSSEAKGPCCRSELLREWYRSYAYRDQAKAIVY